MIRVYLLIVLSCLARFCLGQSVVGKYNTENESHTNRRHYEELILSSDHAFRYFTNMEFIRISKEGTWQTNGDTLILNDGKPCCSEKMSVKEEHDNKITKHTVRFSVTTFEGDLVNYHLVFTDKEGTRTMWSRNGNTEVKASKIKKFNFIVNSLVFSPEYSPKRKDANYFMVQLAPERLFLNEKWIIRNEKIIPLGWDNKYASYHLQKL